LRAVEAARFESALDDRTRNSVEAEGATTSLVLGNRAWDPQDPCRVLAVEHGPVELGDLSAPHPGVEARLVKSPTSGKPADSFRRMADRHGILRAHRLRRSVPLSIPENDERTWQ
jgi:hypothetical protein